MRTEPTSPNNIGYLIQKQKMQRPQPTQTQRINNTQNAARSPKIAAQKPRANLSDIVTPEERDFIQALFSDSGMFRSYRIANASPAAHIRLGSTIDVKA